MKKFVLPAVIGVLALVAAGVVNADPMVGSKSVDVNHPWTLKAGPAWATNAHSQTLGEVGIDYAFEKSATAQYPVIPSIYVDDTFTTSHGSANIADLGVAIRQGFHQDKSTITPYIGAGIGGYYASTSGSNHTSIGGKLYAGVEFQSNWLIEANYTIREEWSGANLNTYGVQAGLRF